MTEPTYIRETVVQYAGPRRRLDKIRHSRDVAAFVRKVIPDSPQERFLAIGCDIKLVPIGWWTVGVGSISACPIVPADVFRAAILAGANTVILAHNHPSGNPTPSPEDVAVTERLQRGGKTIGIEVTDHVIITHGGGHFSFLDAGLLGAK